MLDIPLLGVYGCVRPGRNRAPYFMLKSLEILHTGTTSLEPISSLVNLTYLWVEQCSIQDASCLTALKNLCELALVKLSQLQAVPKITSVDWLNISGTCIRDLAPLAGMSMLQSVYLPYSPGMLGVWDLQSLQYFSVSKSAVVNTHVLTDFRETSIAGHYMRST